MTKGNNIGLSTIADRYAIAMIDLGEKTNQLDILGDDLSKINNTFKSNPELLKFLEHPTITADDKKDVINKIFKDAVTDYALSLTKLLLDRNRIFLFPYLVSHYNDILSKKRNITVAKIITAIDIDDDTKNRVKDKLEKALSCSIKLETRINPDIIAGMVIKIGDKIIDGSIKTKLENMKKQLI
ncbi:MAG: ATP synthase F1 subunit delta [Candidatus Melainabacteria bacterium RIFOXYA12_FULL_32_12]|nr:MAG: ATP synthase F1 subunit delta [Candidatus Melainabacteria bacterium RIFOXYA2_FULL_32_9]OGI28801.1 MAG: ATP synthase F1 subunit delta [Candidatus Melainabacteria bacterium RIFOXYA12_FULL_32_12]